MMKEMLCDDVVSDFVCAVSNFVMSSRGESVSARKVKVSLNLFLFSL